MTRSNLWVGITSGDHVFYKITWSERHTGPGCRTLGRRAAPRAEAGLASKSHFASDTDLAGSVKEDVVNKVEAIIRPEKLISVRDALNEGWFKGG